MTIDIVLKGTIVPVTPISIVRAGAPASEKGAPHMVVVKAGGLDRVAYVPGETMKGLLRNRSADLCFRITKEPMSLPRYYVLNKGGIKGREKEATEDLLNTVKFRNSHPVLGLYGTAAPIWLGGALAVGPAFPDGADISLVNQSDGARRDDFRLDASRFDMLTEEGVSQYVEQTEGTKGRSQKNAEKTRLGSEASKLRKKKDRTDEEEKRLLDLDRQITDIKAELKAIEDSGEVGNTVGRPLDDKLSIAIGSRLTQRIDLLRGTDAEAGLLLATLADLKNNCRIGGMRSIGYGFFQADWTIMVREDVDAEFEAAGTISLAPEKFELVSDHPLIERAKEAWAARRADPASLFVPTKDALR